MSDLLLLFSIWLGTYLCSMGLSVVLFQAFFPFKTKEQLQQAQQLNGSKSSVDRQSARNLRAVTVALLNRSGHLA